MSKSRRTIVGLSLLIKVAPDRLGHLTGLLGDAGVPAATRFLGREGKPYSPTTLEQSEKNAVSPLRRELAHLPARVAVHLPPSQEHPLLHDPRLPQEALQRGHGPAGQGAAHRSPLPGRRGHQPGAAAGLRIRRARAGQAGLRRGRCARAGGQRTRTTTRCSPPRRGRSASSPRRRKALPARARRRRHRRSTSGRATSSRRSPMTRARATPTWPGRTPSAMA